MAMVVMPAAVFAQTPAQPPVAAAPNPPAEDEPAWEFSASVYTYFVPEDRNYVTTDLHSGPRLAAP